MKKHIITATLLLLGLAHAQDDNTNYEDTMKDLPAWAVAFSNLPAEKRAEFTAYFQFAREAFMQARWVECLGHLNNCDLIFNGNPHVWSMRAGSLIEQGMYDEAEESVIKVLEVLPDDPVGLLNLSHIYMGKGEYARCVKELEIVLAALPFDSSRDLRDILLFRIFLCKLMLGDEEGAKQVVSHTNAMDDTPLFYYSQAGLQIFAGNEDAAQKEISTAHKIFKDGSNMRAYHRAIEICKIVDKYVNKKK